jgi:cell fate regulator YaaT (PSP1 superfamily)
MNDRIEKLSLQAANEIADLFKYGFFDQKMVDDLAKIIQSKIELAQADERTDREWCGNAENPVACIGHNHLCREFSCKHYAEWQYNVNRKLSTELNRLKTSTDLCDND